MGAVIGSAAFKDLYMKGKIDKWVRDVKELAEIAGEEPKLVYSLFTKAISHRWTYVQHKIPDIDHHFAPLEEATREKLIPALIGRKFSDTERIILSLPVRYNSMGLCNPTSVSQEFEASTAITKSHTKIIIQQEREIRNYDSEKVQNTIKETKCLKEVC